MVDPLDYFSFQPVLQNWCNNGRGVRYPVCRMMYIKHRKSSLCGGSGFHNRKFKNVLSVSLNKTFLSFLPDCQFR